jgi:hypothetical protein
VGVGLPGDDHPLFILTQTGGNDVRAEPVPPPGMNPGVTINIWFQPGDRKNVLRDAHQPSPGTPLPWEGRGTEDSVLPQLP